MSLAKTALAAIAAVSFALPAFADGITVKDAYARASTKMSISGAAFMVIENTTDTDDRLIAATADVAKRAELHTHIDEGNGVMKMAEVKEGFAVPAHGEHALARGGDHVMLVGLKRPLEQGDVVTLTLTFEKAGEMTIKVPVDLKRKPMPAAMDHSKMNGSMNSDSGN